ncbi:MAG: hypothetical protein ABIR32_02160 [Ilumatobacteraceae bacterium]
MATRTHWGAAGDVAASRHGAFHRSRAVEVGLTNKAIRSLKRSGRLTEPVPGVLVVNGSTDTWQRRLEIATLGSCGAGAASFATAAALGGMDGYAHGPLPHLLLPSWRRQLTTAATLHVGPFDEIDLVDIGGWQSTNIARTLCDIGGCDPIGQVTLAFESAWRKGVSLEWIRGTAERLDCPRRPGPGVILGLVERALRSERPTGSALEVRLGEILASVPGLVRQHSIHTESGSFVARPDFAVPDVRLAIEAHSRQFHFGPVATDHDEDREHRMTEQGWQSMFFGASHMRRPADVLRKVMTTVDRRRRDLG